MQAAKDWLVYLLVRIFICITQAMRIETCETIGGLAAVAAHDLLRLRRKVVDDNLRHAFPALSKTERNRIARGAWQHFWLMACELIQAPRKIHDTNWRRHIDLVGKRDLVRHLLDVRSAILISGHFGNFEMASFTAGLLGVPTYTVARPLDNPHLQRSLTQFRESSGQYFLPKVGGSPLMEAALNSGAAIAVLPDQYGGDKGIWVEFFGRPASCHKSVALLALLYKSPLLVCYAKRRRRPLFFEMGLAGYVDPTQPDARAANATALTAWYCQALEAVIRSAPDQYWWLHRRWREPSEHIRRRVAERAA